MVRELKVDVPEPEIPWETKCDFFYDLAFDGVPLPENFEDALTEEFAHLAPTPAVRAPENQRAWEAYKLWAGDVVEDVRTPRERLEAYFAEQEEKLA